MSKIRLLAFEMRSNILLICYNITRGDIMYWFLRVIRNTIRRMSKQEVDKFLQQHSFSDVDKLIIKYISLGHTTSDIMVRVNMSKNELYKHYEIIAKELTQEW